MPTDHLLPELEKRLLDIKVKLASNDKAAEAGATLSSTMQDEISEHYLRVYEELNQLSHYIDEAKVQIAVLCPDEIRNDHLPAATDQLDAIVADTEKATNTILEAAEIIAAKAKELDAPEITEQVIKIFEASSFQGLTGQRTSKVIATLKFIDESIHRLILAFFGNEADDMREAKPQRDMNAEDALLDGPQLPGEENKQEKIDAVLAKYDLAISEKHHVTQNRVARERVQ